METSDDLVLPSQFTHPDLPDLVVPVTPDIHAWVLLATRGGVPWQHSMITRHGTEPSAGLLLHVGPNANTCVAAAFTTTGRWLYTTFSPGAQVYCPRSDEGITALQASRLVGIQLESDARINSWMAYRLNTHQWTRAQAEHDRLTRLNFWVQQGHYDIIRAQVLEILAAENPDRFHELHDAAQVEHALSHLMN